MNKIIYHDHCMDGFAAAYIAVQALKAVGEDYELIPMSYNQALDMDYFKEEDNIYTVDFSFPPSTMIEIGDKVNKLIWLDHHKTAIEAWDKWLLGNPSIDKDISMYLYYELDLYRSGAGLTWDYFYPQTPRPSWVNWIEDRDLWRFNYPESKAFHAGLSAWIRSIECWEHLLDEPNKLVSEGEGILRANQKMIQEIIDESSNDIVILGQRGLAANCPPQFASDAGHILATMSGTFGATWHQTKSGDIKFSLRSNGSFDVSAIAKEFGGGGHKNAAGFVLKDPTRQEGIATIWSTEDQLIVGHPDE